jgi:hypothetical protein
VLSAEATKTTEAKAADPAAEPSTVNTTKTAEPTANCSDATNGTDATTQSTSKTACAKSTTKTAAHCLVRRVTQTHLSLVDHLRLAAALLHVPRRCRRAGC